MYPVSDGYKAAIKNAVHISRITGQVGDLPFSQSNILAGSFSISNQCSGQKNVEIGQVYVGQLKATFLGLNIAVDQWPGKVITPYFELLVGDAYEAVPLGVFTVSEAKKSKAGMVVTAYDNMAKFDGRIDTEVVTGTKTPYQWLTDIMTACGMALGNTEEEVQALPNGTEGLSLYDDHEIVTWRDALSCLSQALCSYMTAGRDGNILIRTYNQTVVDTLDAGHRGADGAYSDFVTNYTTIWFDNLKDGTENSYSSGSGGLVYEAGSNPFMQDEDTRDGLRRNVLAGLQQIRYSPFSVTVMPDPSYDLGDVIRLSGGLADRTGCITKYSFKRKGMKLTGVGSDPKLAEAKDHAAKSVAAVKKETASQISQISSQVAVISAEVSRISGAVMANYILPFGVSLDEIRDTDQGGTPTNVLMFRVQNDTEGNTATFYAELGFNVHTFEKNGCYQDAVVTIEYLYDNQVIQTQVEYFGDGWKIIMLNAILGDMATGTHTFYVRMSAQGASLY